jgi:DNA-binding CsgD family transcriptional regulator
MGAFGAVPMALLMFYDSAQVASQTPEFLAEVFNLSPAEAQVAVQLTQGLTLKEIAQERKVSLTTVQSQLKSLKEKTATTRQPDLVRKLVAMTVLFD